MPSDLEFDLSATQSAFVHSNADIVMLMGAMGEGKTHAGVAGTIRHAARCGNDIQTAVVRDTHQNIKTSTVPSIKEILGDWVSFHDDEKKMVIHSTPRVSADLFGIDDEASLSKLQGPQYALIWLEEPAPIIEKANAGLPRSVFEMAIARSARQTGTVMRVQVTQNPADEDHWTEEVANGPRIWEEDPETGLQIIKEVFRIAYGENKFLNPKARLANKAAFRNDPGKYARYVDGVPAPVQLGMRVTPFYNTVIHYAKRELPVIPNALGLRFYDGWHHPVCILAQYIPPGKIWVHHAFYGSGMGVKELLEQQVIPVLMSPKFKGKIPDWRDIGDPTMRTPDQSTTGESAARRVERLLGTRFEPGPTKWTFRIDPLRQALTNTSPADGKPLIQISSTAYDLHRALNGGWHWKCDNNGRRIGNLPVQGEKHGDIGNAFAYGVAVVMPSRAMLPVKVLRQGTYNPLKRAMSYSTTPYPGHGQPPLDGLARGSGGR